MASPDVLSRNLLLRTLSPASLQRLGKVAQLTEIHEGETLFDAETANDVFFPIDSVISLLREFPDGGGIEITMVGAPVSR